MSVRPFEFCELDNGIDLIFNWGGTKAEIRIIETGLIIGNKKIGTTKYRFYQFSNLLSSAIIECLKDYEPRRKGKFLRVKQDHWANFLPKYRKGMAAKQQKLLSKAFKPLWERLLLKADQNAVALDKNLQHAKGPKADYNDFLKVWTKVKDNKWVLRDCAQFIPAILYYLNEYGQSWRHYYANGEPYKAINQTLDAIRYPLAFKQLAEIREIKIERPILTRLELLSVLDVGTNYTTLLPFVFKTDAKELKKSIKKLAKLRGQKCDLRKTHGFENTYYLHDFIRHEPYNGTMLGLVKKAHEWHERMARDRTAAQLIRQAQWEKEHAEELAKDNIAPTFDLSLLDEKVRFLSKVKDLHDEGKLMRHCVSGYSDYTLKGRSFIFHVDYGDEMATVELDKNYEVKQSNGVKNAKNKATEWAKKYFYNFVKEWKEANVKLLECGAA